MITLNFRADFRGGFFLNRMDFRVMLPFDNELESGFSFPIQQEHKNFETLPTALSPITFSVWDTILSGLKMLFWPGYCTFLLGNP